MKRYIIEAKPCPDELPKEPDWYQVGEEFTDLDEAEREWTRLDDLWGHNTYHRLVEVKRKVLKEA